MQKRCMFICAKVQIKLPFDAFYNKVFQENLYLCLMQKIFNIAGPCIPGDHYMLPALERNEHINSLIVNKQYFVIHAARQTGKTTLLNSLEWEINESSQYIGLYCSLETVQGINDPKEGIPAIARSIQSAISINSHLSELNFLERSDINNYNNIIKEGFYGLCKKLSLPLIVFFDEADCLSNGTLITFLRQLRDGFVNRTRAPFPHSIALVGMRDIRDYKGKIRENGQTLGSANPFNIITKSLTIGNFTLEEVRRLYLQHTEDKGQVFEDAAIEKAFYWTQGQPWLVNALARECVMEILREDFSKPITEDLIDQASQNIMDRCDTHIDSLLERLKEERVKNVIQPIILGEEASIPIFHDDTQYCIDLGIIKQDEGKLLPSNHIYNEVIMRTLNADTQFYLYDKIKPDWISKDGKIDMNGLLKGFQDFWRENSDIWSEKYQYKEAAPHLIMQAFLQRVINGGGTINREYATGRRRIDLCVNYKNNRYLVELKLWYNEKTISEGIEQLSDYLDRLGEKEGWLVVFDQKTGKSWDEKIFWETHETSGKTLHLVGC